MNKLNAKEPVGVYLTFRKVCSQNDAGIQNLYVYHVPENFLPPFQRRLCVKLMYWSANSTPPMYVTIIVRNTTWARKRLLITTLLKSFHGNLIRGVVSSWEHVYVSSVTPMNRNQITWGHKMITSNIHLTFTLQYFWVILSIRSYGTSCIDMYFLDMGQQDHYYTVCHPLEPLSVLLNLPL